MTMLLAALVTPGRAIIAASLVGVAAIVNWIGWKRGWWT